MSNERNSETMNNKVKKLKNMLSGWGKTMGLMRISPEAQAREQIARLQVCVQCAFAKESKALEIINGSTEKTDVIYCTACHCPCMQKSLSDDVCGKGFWAEADATLGTTPNG